MRTLQEERSGSLMSGVAPENSTPVTGKLAHTHTETTCLFLHFKVLASTQAADQ